MAIHKKLLKVTQENGQSVCANIIRAGNNVTIKVDKLELVKIANPDFSKDGVIAMTIDISKYQDAIIKITKYLEDLFLKGMADNDSKITSNVSRSDTRRNDGKNSKRKVKSSERQGNYESLHSGSRGNKHTKDVELKNTTTDLEQSDNPSDSIKDK